MRLGTVGASTIWATPHSATIGTRLDNAAFEFKLVSADLLPFHLLQLIHLRPLPEPEPIDVSVLAEAMLTAEELLHNGERAGAMRELRISGAGEWDAAAVLSILDSRVASWRIVSLRSGGKGSATHRAHGMDCGPAGNIYATIDPAGSTIRLRTASFTEVTAVALSALAGPNTRDR
jgi:hypothetical protein